MKAQQTTLTSDNAKRGSCRQQRFQVSEQEQKITLERSAQADTGNVVDDLHPEVVGREELLPELALLLRSVSNGGLCKEVKVDTLAVTRHRSTRR